MSGQCVEKMSHPACGSKDGLQVFEEGGRYTGFCFRCGTFIRDPYEEGHTPPTSPLIKSPEEIQQELDDIKTYQVLDLSSRGLKREYLEYFSVRIGVDERDGQSPRYVFFPYFDKHHNLISYKTRVLDPKRQWFIGKGERVPFGWQEAIASGAKKLFIVEGEFDVIALFQILKDLARGGQWEELDPAVISFPNGAQSIQKAFGEWYQVMKRRFEKIIFVPDQDEPGRKAAEDLVKVYPSVIIADLPCKDVNEGLLAGKKKAVQKAVLFQATVPKNTNLINITELTALAREKPQWGLDWPWQQLTDVTRGIRRGETIYFGAGAKVGKSEMVNALACHLTTVHNLHVLLVKPEENTKRSTKMVYGKVVKRIFHDPKVDFDYDAYDRAAKLVKDRVTFVDKYQHLSWDVVRSDIRYAVQVLGIKDVFLDPITCFTNQMSASATNEFLVSMSADLSAMALDMDFTAYIFCHLNKPPEGQLPHERGGKVYSHQFAGSRAMMRSCNYMIGMEGNKDPALPDEERNLRKLVILEDREFGESAVIQLYWDRNTGVFIEVKNEAT